MKPKKIFITLIFLVIFGLLAAPALAHSPRLVERQDALEERPIVINNPDISQAFYGRLKGWSEYYQVSFPAAQEFYFQTLVPDIQNIQKNISAELIETESGKIIARLDASKSEWLEFFEPFAGDRYFTGPEKTLGLDPGTYLIRVYNPENEGKYILVVGKKELFTAKEVFNTIVSLPSLKLYFNESPWGAYFNRVGLFLGAAILALILVLWFLRFVFRRRQ